MDITRELFLSGQALGQVFGRTADVIKRWAYECNAKRIEKNGRVKYYLPDMLNHFLNRYFKPEIEDEKKLKLEIEAVKLEKERLALRKMKDEVYEKEEVELAWAQRLAYVRQALTQLEFHLASELSGKELSTLEVREIVKNHTRRIMEEFSAKGRFTKSGDTDRKRKKGDRATA